MTEEQKEEEVLTVQKDRAYVTYRAVVVVSLTNLLLILSFVITILSGHKASIHEMMNTHVTQFDERIDAAEFDIDNIQIVIMEKSILSGENDEAAEQDTAYLCVDIPDPLITIGRVDTRKESDPPY